MLFYKVHNFQTFSTELSTK